MRPRPLHQLITAHAVSEGAGVAVQRSIGIPELRNLDPFLMLDHFSSTDPDDYIAGFPEHPHRGFCTFTHMLDGHMEHRDSLANCGDLQAGGAQWMKAARGVIHSEMPKQTAGRMRGFQLWVNLPAAAKMDAPEYRDFAPQDIPEVVNEGARIRVFAGQYAGLNAGRQGVVTAPHTDLIYLDIALTPGARFSHPLPPGHTAFVYVFEGAAMLADTPLPGHGLAVLGQGDGVELAATEAGARLILVAGRPLYEPIVQYGPFVMNTREEIEQAYADYRAGRFVTS